MILTPREPIQSTVYYKLQQERPRVKDEGERVFFERENKSRVDQATIAIAAAPFVAGLAESPFVIVVSPSATSEILGAGGGSLAERNSLILGIDARRRCVGRASSSTAEEGSRVSALTWAR